MGGKKGTPKKSQKLRYKKQVKENILSADAHKHSSGGPHGPFEGFVKSGSVILFHFFFLR
jgi:hypothetical protein